MSTGLLEGQANGPDADIDKGTLVGTEGTIAPATTQTAPEDLDVDDLHLDALRKAAEAEEPGSTAAPSGSETQTTTPAGAQPDQTNDQQQPGTRPKAVPIERFQEVYNDRKAKEAEIARLSGEILALKSQAPAAQPTVNPQIATLDQQITALAKKFDDGEITYSELKTQERALQSQIDTIREADIVARAAQRSQPAAQPVVEDLTFQRETARIEAAYEPFMELIPDAYLEGFVASVRAELAAKGVTEIRKGSEELLMFREACGRVAQAQAAHWSAISGKPIPKAGGQQTQPAPTRQAPAGQPTVAQRLAKLDMQADMPPNLSGLMKSGGLDTDPTDASIESMSDDEIAALPAATRARIMGTLPQ